MTSVQSGLSSQYNNHQGYQPSAFQGQNSYSASGQDQNSVYMSSQQTGSAYPSQTNSSYQTPSSSSYPSQTVNTSSSYQASNNTSNASFSQSANSSSFPSQSDRSGSSYQNQSNLANSYPGQGSSNSSSSGGYANHASGYQNQSGTYHSRDSRDTTNTSYQTSVSQSGSSYQSGSSQSNSSYPSGNSQSNSTYPAQVSQASSSGTNSNYTRDSQTSQATFGSHQSYGSSSSHQSNLQTSPMATTKLTESLNKMSVKDNSPLDSAQHSSYDHTSSSSTTSASLTTTTSTTSSSLASGSVNVTSAGLGLNTTAASTLSVTSTTTATSKAALPHTSKAPPNLAQGMPPAMLGPNYMIGQPGMPFIGLAAQQPLYYEDMQVLQQRLPLTGYYEMPFQPPTTLTGRDQNTLASAPYTGAEQKMNRVDAQSPVQAAQTSQQQQQTQSAAAHQQTFINPATLPPGYNYHYYAGGMLPGGYSFTPTMFPVGNLVPNVTNAAAHGGTTANAQFQKPGAAYGSHAYGTGFEDVASQGQDFKAYGNVAPSQAKAGGAATVTSTTADITGTGYSKTHAQSYDKTAGFHAGTPPPFSLPLPTGTQAGAMAAPQAAYAPYMQMMTAHQPHSQMLHHHLQQDSTGGSSRGSAQGTSQAKPGGNKPYSTAYWGTN